MRESPRHSLVARPVAGLGALDVEAEAYEDAIRSDTRARDLMATAYGEHAYLLQPLVGLGRAYARGQDAEARASYERAMAIAERPGTSGAELGAMMAVVEAGEGAGHGG